MKIPESAVAPLEPGTQISVDSVWTDPITFGDFAYQVIQKQFKKATKYKADVLADQDPEALHQMRVGMRRLRTAVQVLGVAIIPNTGMEIRKISKIAKDLGKVRDLDVLHLWFQDYLNQTTLTPGEAQELQQVLKRLQTRRVQQFTLMRKLFASQRYRDFITAYKHWLKHPTYTELAAIPLTLLLPDLLGPLISTLFLHPGWLVATEVENGVIQPTAMANIQILDQGLADWGEQVHDLRKQMKRVRYQTEFFTNFYGDTFRQQSRDFRMLQDLLGLLQDGMVLEDFLKEDLGPNWSRRIPSLANALQQERWQLWQDWQISQYKFLQPDFRATIRSILSQPYQSSHRRSA